MSDTNSLLLDPNSSTSQKVAQLAAMTKPLPVKLQAEPVYFHCTLPNHHMHRTDGKRLAFVFGILKTHDMNDIAYLDNEIADGNPFLRKASENEVNVFSMRVDPKGTIQAQLRPQIEEEVKQQLSAQLAAAVQTQMDTIDIGLTPEQKAALLEKFLGSSQPDTSDTSGAGIAGTEAIQNLKGAMQTGVQTGTGRLLGMVGTNKLPNAADSGK